MKRALAVATIALATTAAAPAAAQNHVAPAVDGLEQDRIERPWLKPDPAPVRTASRRPYLGYGEAARYIGRELHQNFEYGAVTGTLDTYCRRRARNRVRCQITFQDLDGDWWYGYARVAEYRLFYSVRWNVDI